MKITLTFCKMELKLLDRIFPKLRDQHNVIKQLLGRENTNSNKRSKRAWFDIIGKTSKILFGTLDSDDAIYYDNQINKLSRNENHVSSMLQEQSHIIKTTIKNFNETITNLNTNENLLINNMKKLEVFVNSNNKKLNKLQAREILVEQFSILNLLVSEYDKETSILIEAILFAQKGILHPFILTPEQFVNNLQKIIQHIPANTEFPVSLLVENSHILLKLIDLNVVYVNNKLIYIIEVPLVQSYIFNLYHLIPLPVKQNSNKYLFIQPTSEYFAIDDNRQHYLVIQNDVKYCKNVNVNYYVCKQTQPLHLTHNNDNCESKLYLIPNKIPSNCDIRIVNIENNIWHQLQTSNSWLFLLTKPETLSINCKTSKNVIDIKLSKSGVISLNHDCIAYSKSTLLSAKRIFSNKVSLEYLPPVNLNLENLDLMYSETNISNVKLRHSYRSNTLISSELKSYSEKIDSIDFQNNYFENKISTTTYITYSIIAICFVAN